jgi:hypothetical protein
MKSIEFFACTTPVLESRVTYLIDKESKNV